MLHLSRAPHYPRRVPATGSLTVGRARALVGLLALVVLAGKLLLAAGTFGTEDVRTWTGFAAGVSREGPVGVYGIDFGSLNGTLYNHPPLVGYYLAFINFVARFGVPLGQTLRAVSSAADVVSALLVLEILRSRTSLTRAAICGVGVALSPVLVLVSGYHGNTDPVFVMLVLLGTFLLVDKHRAASAGVVLGLAVGIKIVPVVVLPTLAVYLLRSRRDLLLRVAVASAVTMLITWGPALLLQGAAVIENVLGYKGVSDRPWGIVRAAVNLGHPAVADFLAGPGSSLVVLACALLPAVLAWRRPRATVQCVALSLAALLLLSPAFSVQYFAWALAAAYLLDPWSATLYNAVGGVFLFRIYQRWAGESWADVSNGQVLVSSEVAIGAVLWCTLALVVARGVLSVLAGDARIHSLTATVEPDCRHGSRAASDHR